MNERFVPVWHNEDLVDLLANEPLADGKAWSPSWRASKIDDVPVFAANNPYADTYGMLWYKSHRTFGGKRVDYLFASGNGGNHLIVIPENEMVIALTSSAYGQGYGHRRSYNIMVKILSSLE